MNSRTLSDLKDSSESLVEINEKNKNNIKTAQVSLNYHTSQANNVAQAYSMAQMKYNQAVSARNAAANRPRQEGEAPESISREMSMYNRMVADAERVQQEARNKYKVSLQHQKKAVLDYQKAQADFQDSVSKLTSIKSELGSKISDYTNSYTDASALLMFGKGENIQPFMQKLLVRKKEAISTLNRVLRSLGEQELSVDGGELPGGAETDSPKVKKLVKYPLGRRRGQVNAEARGAHSTNVGFTNSRHNDSDYSNVVEKEDFTASNNKHFNQAYPSNTFGEQIELVQDRLSSERYFSRGNHFNDFQKLWENDNYTISRQDNSKIIYVRARDIEGVYIWKNEKENPENFWTRNGMNGWTRGCIIEKASCIEAIRQQIDSGISLEEISKNSEYDETIGSFYRNPIKLTSFDSFYIFQGDGRHRILAAQTIDAYIPVLITEAYDLK